MNANKKINPIMLINDNINKPHHQLMFNYNNNSMNNYNSYYNILLDDMNTRENELQNKSSIEYSIIKDDDTNKDMMYNLIYTHSIISKNILINSLYIDLNGCILSGICKIEDIIMRYAEYNNIKSNNTNSISINNILDNNLEDILNRLRIPSIANDNNKPIIWIYEYSINLQTYLMDKICKNIYTFIQVYVYTTCDISESKYISDYDKYYMNICELVYPIIKMMDNALYEILYSYLYKAAYIYTECASINVN